MKTAPFLLLLTGLLLIGLCLPSLAWAYGSPGCANLPDYDRAVGALQGMTGACDMTVEQAERIVAQQSATMLAPTAPAGKSMRNARHRARHGTRRPLH